MNKQVTLLCTNLILLVESLINDILIEYNKMYLLRNLFKKNYLNNQEKNLKDKAKINK